MSYVSLDSNLLLFLTRQFLCCAVSMHMCGIFVTHPIYVYSCAILTFGFRLNVSLHGECTSLSLSVVVRWIPNPKTACPIREL